MKRYLWLLLLLILMPMVYAAVPLYSLYTVYLDGQPLENFNLSVAHCIDSRYIDDESYSSQILSYDPAKNCTWLLNMDNPCQSSPCVETLGLSGQKVYLVTQEKAILTDEIIEESIGEYDLFIHSDGSVESEYLREVVRTDSLIGTLRDLTTFEFILLFMLIVLVETGAAYVYFRKKHVSYQRLWSVVVANIITFILCSVVIISYNVFVVILVPFIIVIEAIYYKWSIREFRWKDAFILSLLANVSNIVLIVVIPMILMIQMLILLLSL